ncbi:hypothetical protein B0H13DRAFT_2088031 [Mycena leptocephala]|nr:hypothetical protein B0H13DRAFT_2088031 [Mycena leptocephala]
MAVQEDHSDPLLSNDVLRDSSARLARRCGTARSTAARIQHSCIVRRAAQRVRLCVRNGLGPLPRVPVSGARPRVSKLCGPCTYSSRAAGERCICVRRWEWPGGWRGARSDSANSAKDARSLVEYACPLRIFILRWDGLYHLGAVGCGAGVRCSLPRTWSSSCGLLARQAVCAVNVLAC